REAPQLLPLPRAERVEPFLREERRVGRDGFVAWERGWYGVPWTWAGQRVHVAVTESTVEIGAGGPCTRARRAPGSVWCCPGSGPACPAPTPDAPRSRSAGSAPRLTSRRA